MEELLRSMLPALRHVLRGHVAVVTLLRVNEAGPGFELHPYRSARVPIAQLLALLAEPGDDPLSIEIEGDDEGEAFRVTLDLEAVR